MFKIRVIVACVLVLGIPSSAVAKNQDDKIKPSGQGPSSSLPANSGKKIVVNSTVPSQQKTNQGDSAPQPSDNGQGGGNANGNAGAKLEEKPQPPAKSQIGNGNTSNAQANGNRKPIGADAESLITDAKDNLSYIVRFVQSASSEASAIEMIDAYNEDVRKTNKLRSAKSSVKRGVVTRSFQKVINGAVIEVSANAVAGLLRNPKVLSIEKDAALLVEPVSSTQIGVTWGLDRIDQRALPLSGSFSSPTTASNVSIYVVDTGIDATHPEFTGRVVAGVDVISGGDGRTDCNSHGTHVAGIAAGAVHGVAKAARLVPVRVLDCDGSGSISGVIAGLEWIVSTRSSVERSIVNMSLGGGVSASLDAAVATLIGTGVTVVVAAGNSNADACSSSPARTAPAITVGSTTSVDSRSSFSNYGSCVDIFAPGSGITAAVPGGGTAVLSGTSMAAPHVAGIAAVALSVRLMSPSELSALLADNSTKGLITNVGIGSPNNLAFLSPTNENPTEPDPAPIVSIPDQPQTPQAEARNKAAVISWQLPDNGGSALTAFVIRAYAGGRVVSIVTVDGITSTARISRLRNGTEYLFTVQARNAVGNSLESAVSNAVVPAR